MIEKLLQYVPGVNNEETNSGDNSSEDFNPTRGEDYQLDPDKFKQNEKVDLKDLNPGEQLKLVILNFGTSKEELKNKWENDQIEIYFLFFSVIGAVAMLLSIRYGTLTTTSILFVIYAIITIPTLYAYEESGLLDENKQPTQTSSTNSNNQNQDEN